MPFGIMGGLNTVDSLLAAKYAALAQQARAAETAANAGARLDNVRADLLPNESRANVAKTDAETGQIKENTRFIAPLNLANIGLISAQTGQTQANTADTVEGAITKRSLNQNFGMGGSSSSLGYGGGMKIGNNFFRFSM